VTRRSFWSGLIAQGSSSATGNVGEPVAGVKWSSEERSRTGEGTKRSG
jgi:hypothetical protein